MTAADPTSLQPLLKRLYPNGLAWSGFKRSKLLAMCRKVTTFGGEGKYVVVDIAPTTGGSSDFTMAQTNEGPSTTKRFFVTHAKEYQLASLSGDVLARSMGNKNAIVAALKHEFDKAGYAFGRALAQRVWGNGGGQLGVMDGTGTTANTYFILATTADAVRFEKGMYIQLASDDGSGASPAGLYAATTLQVTKVDRSTGRIDLSAAISTVSGATTSSHVFRAGDYANAMTGLQGWAPITAPASGDSLFGLDRYAAGDIERLSGIRVDGGGQPKEDTLIDASAEGHLRGIEPKQVFCNPLDFRDIVKEMGTKRIIEVTTNVGIGFRALEVEGNAGPMQVISEPDCPKGYAWMLDVANLSLETAGECPMLLNEDGVGKLLRSASDDAYEFRLGAYGNFFHQNPGETVIITW